MGEQLRSRKRDSFTNMDALSIAAVPYTFKPYNPPLLIKPWLEEARRERKAFLHSEFVKVLSVREKLGIRGLLSSLQKEDYFQRLTQELVDEVKDLPKAYFAVVGEYDHSFLRREAIEQALDRLITQVKSDHLYGFYTFMSKFDYLAMLLVPNLDFYFMSYFPARAMITEAHAAYLIVYVILTVLFRIPITTLGIGLGQYVRKTMISVWKLFPLLRGCAFTLLANTFIGVVRVAIVYSYGILYMLLSVFTFISALEECNDPRCENIPPMVCLPVAGTTDVSPNLPSQGFILLESLARNQYENTITKPSPMSLLTVIVTWLSPLLLVILDYPAIVKVARAAAVITAVALVLLSVNASLLDRPFDFGPVLSLNFDKIDIGLVNELLARVLRECLVGSLGAGLHGPPFSSPIHLAIYSSLSSLVGLGLFTLLSYKAASYHVALYKLPDYSCFGSPAVLLLATIPQYLAHFNYHYLLDNFYFFSLVSTGLVSMATSLFGFFACLQERFLIVRNHRLVIIVLTAVAGIVWDYVFVMGIDKNTALAIKKNEGFIYKNLCLLTTMTFLAGVIFFYTTDRFLDDLHFVSKIQPDKDVWSLIYYLDFAVLLVISVYLIERYSKELELMWVGIIVTWILYLVPLVLRFLYLYYKALRTTGVLEVRTSPSGVEGFNEDWCRKREAFRPWFSFKSEPPDCTHKICLKSRPELFFDSDRQEALRRIHTTYALEPSLRKS